MNRKRWGERCCDPPTGKSINRLQSRGCPVTLRRIGKPRESKIDFCE